MKTISQILTELGVTESTTVDELIDLLTLVTVNEKNGIKSISVKPLPNVMRNKADELKDRLTNITIDENYGMSAVLDKRIAVLFALFSIILGDDFVTTNRISDGAITWNKLAIAVQNIVNNKVNILDVVDNLTTKSHDKPLSAGMGKLLADRIAAITSGLTNASYNSETGILTITYEAGDTYSMKIGLDSNDISIISNNILNDVNDDLTTYKNGVNQSLEDMTETIESLGQLQPSDADTSTNILAKTTADGIWIGTDTGHWYYWNGTQYADGGVYQATAIADSSITTPKLASDCLVRYPYLSNIDLNTITTFGRYVCVGCSNGPTSNLLFLEVKIFKTTESNPAWIIQEVYDFSTKFKHIRMKYDSSSESWSSWTKLLMDNINTNDIEDLAITTSKIANNSITTDKTSDEFLMRLPYLNGSNLNDIKTYGRYVAISCTNCPTNDTYLIDVKAFKTGASDVLWVIQDAYSLGDGKKYYRYFNGASWGVWKELDVGDNIRVPYLNAENLNNVTNFGKYMCISCTNAPKSNATYMLDVKNFKTYEGDTKWVIQEVFEFTTGLRYFREYYTITATWGDWHLVNVDGDVKRLLGKKILNLGDSIFGNIQGDNSISNQIALLSGANVINGGFGGCRMSVHDTGTWDLCSMYRIADYIKNNDFTDLINGVTTGWSGMPYYFPETANNIANIDYSELDCITISYGTNDYAYDNSVLDNPNNKFDTSTVCGALRYSIKAIQETHPQIKILVTTPIFRMFLDNNYDVLYTSDEHDFGSGTLIEYSEAIKQACKDMHIPCLDLYYDSNMNLYTRLEYWGSTDGTHPNATGNKNMAILIERKLETIL